MSIPGTGDMLPDDAAGLRPVTLPANQPPQFYRGGASIAALRGDANERDFGPEDWLASTTPRFGQDSSGLSLLPHGTFLREAVAAAPAAWLGPEHEERFGSSTALLVKLLDAGQRLPVHCHPSNEFAQAHFHCPFGKTESWIVVGTSENDPAVYLGFRDDVDADTVEHWVSTQDSSSMVHALNRIPVRTGDTVVVPAGTPHAIGSGVFVVEVQQPTDFSITLEWQGFLDSPKAGHLGLGFDTALSALDRSAWDATKLSTVVRHTQERAEARVPLLAEAAADFFRADRLHPREGAVELEPSFGVVIALEGSGTLHTTNGGDVPIRRGHTLAVPHGAGEAKLEGDVVAVHCRPPRP